MGSSHSLQYVNYEDIQQQCIYTKIDSILLINTLPNDIQDCLIQNTIHIEEEESIMNTILKQNTMKDYTIYIYGKHSNDISCVIKNNQLIQLGFNKDNIYIYNGGLFEWMLLQDIFGYNEFPTTIQELDVLKYKPNSDYQKKNIKLLTHHP